MTFVWPLGLLAFLLVPALAWAYTWSLRRQAQASISYPAVSLLAQAAAAGRPWRRHVPVVFYLSTLCAMIVALARPVWPIPVPDNEAAVMLSIDVSGSMIETDVHPSRIEAAKRVATEFVRALPAGARVGLVKFSTHAVLMTPPTKDHDRVVTALASLQPEASTAIGDGLLKAVYALPGRAAWDPSARPLDPPLGVPGPASAGPSAGPSVSMPSPASLPPAAVVLMSDGGNNTGTAPEDAAAIARRLRVTVHTVGLGQPANATVNADGERVSDVDALDEDTLRHIASVTNGTYHRASTEHGLSSVWSHIGRMVAWTTRPVEVGGLVSGASAVLFGGTLLLSLLWRRID
jgi:Ca-activated chloride channel homolog